MIAAEAFGLPLLPPSANKGTNFSQGANFAVMGATALELQYFKDNNVWSIPPFNTSMNVQLEWFQEVKHCPSDPASCHALFGRSCSCSASSAAMTTALRGRRTSRWRK